MGIVQFAVLFVVVLAGSAIVLPSKDWSQSILNIKRIRNIQVPEKTVLVEAPSKSIGFDKDSSIVMFRLAELLQSYVKQGDRIGIVETQKTVKLGVHSRYGFQPFFTLNAKGVWLDRNNKPAVWDTDKGPMATDAINDAIERLHTPKSIGVRPTRQPEPDYEPEYQYDEVYS